MPKLLPFRSSMPETPPAVSGLALISMSRLAAIANGSTGSAVMPSSRKNASPFCLAIFRRKARLTARRSYDALGGFRFESICMNSMAISRSAPVSLPTSR